MPKSKRAKVYSLTRTEKKGRASKESLVEEIRGCLERFKRVYVFTFHNQRNVLLKDVRESLKNSRFFLGKNKVMQIALGRTKEDEQKPQLRKLAKRLVGHVGLLFTNDEPESVQAFFDGFRKADYARAGSVATETVALPAGPLEQFTHSQETHLREKLLVPVELKRGVVVLRHDFTVCQKGASLTAEQANFLKLLAIPQAEFRLTLDCVWDDGEFSRIGHAGERIAVQDEEDNDDDEEEEEDEE